MEKTLSLKETKLSAQFGRQPHEDENKAKHLHAHVRAIGSLMLKRIQQCRHEP